MITTVLGDIAPEELGFCQCHEHLLIADGVSRRVDPNLYMDDVDRSAREAAEYRRLGGVSLVDAQPPGAGRMAAGLVEISRRTGVQIVCVTGFHRRCFYPPDHWTLAAPAEAPRDWFLRELTVGVGSGTVVPRGAPRAGLVKVALEAEGVSPRRAALFEAAALAAASAQVAIMVHTDPGADAMALLDFLEDRGVPPARAIFCHLDRTEPDIAHHLALCARGAYLEYDTIARYKYHGDNEETALFLRILEAGYQERLLCSLDTTRARLRAYGGSPGLGHILSDFLPLLYADRVTREQVDAITRKNPASALSRPAEVKS